MFLLIVVFSIIIVGVGVGVKITVGDKVIVSVKTSFGMGEIVTSPVAVSS